MTSVLGVVDMMNLGAPVRVAFELIAPLDAECPGMLRPEAASLQERETRESLEWARWYTAAVVGWPKGHDVAWKVESVRGSRLPVARGPSLFGTLCMGLMQLVATQDPAAVHHWSRCATACVRNTPLQRVVVSAAFDPRQGTFGPVGAIDAKLRGLAPLKRDVCMVCVVAQGQQTGFPRTAIDAAAGLSIVAIVPQQDIALVEAADPVDAFRKLFKVQAHLVAKYFLR